MHRLISAGNTVYLPTDGSYPNPLLHYDENSNSGRLWKESLEKVGLDSNNYGVEIGDLFALIKKAFEVTYHCKLDATFTSMYIAAGNGDIPLKHDSASRAFSAGKMVYVDKLMVNVLFEYVANYYLWARFEKDAFSFCFPYAANLLDICCRQGFLNSDEERSRLLQEIAQRCDGRGMVFISNMYWSIIAFIMCHELAHIYIDSNMPETVSAEEAEILADEYGYKVYLSLIDGKASTLNAYFMEIFHDYLYAAPMILFLFYEDLYFMESWIYGESLQLREHDPFEARIDRLIEISRNDEYTFDLDKGDDVLNNFWDISELFREELFYKLKNGKLISFIQKGYCNMNNISGYEQAIAFDNDAQQKIKELAANSNIDQGKVLGLYQIAAKYEVMDGDVADRGLVKSVEGKTVSIKPYNLRFRLTASLAAIIDTGVTLYEQGEQILTTVQLLKILLILLGDMTIAVSEDQARVLIESYKLHANHVPVDEEIVLANANVTHSVIDQLCSMKCIELEAGQIRLLEVIKITSEYGCGPYLQVKLSK